MLLPVIIAALGATALGTSALGGWLWLRRGKRASESSAAPAPRAALAHDPLRAFGLQLGDVLQRDDDEFWVTGAWVMTESVGPVASVCCLSDETSAEQVLLSLGADVRVVCSQVSTQANWLQRPMSIVVNGAILQRKSVIPVDVQSVGKVCAAFHSQAVWMVYADVNGDRETVWVLADDEHALAWRGAADELETWRNLGGGSATLRTWD